MAISRKVLCVVYGLIGLIALVGCWGNNVQYLNLHLGILGVNAHFWGETLVNPATRSITIDILFLSLAAIIWMLLEARRLSMRGVWIYVVLGVFVAISFAFPAFLIHRERTLARRDGSTSAGTLSVGDVIGVAVLGLCMLAYLFIALGR
jgi:cbb3-type cytochrome oxidase subunit 3